MADFSPRTLDDLAHRVDWMRALARRLVADPDLAEDVVQDGAVAALEHGHQARRAAPWMSGVLRNAAANLRRRATRAARAERGRVPDEPAPSAADTAALVEQQRVLAEAVLSLPEPFRDVVLLRFYDDLSQREIARRLGIAEGTVGSRLARAIERLRGLLDQRHGGDRRAWIAALAPLPLGRAPAPSRNPLSPTASGATKLGGAGLAVVLVGATSVLWQMAPGHGPPHPAAPTAPTAAADRGDAPIPEAAPPRTPARTAETQVAAAQPGGHVAIQIVDGATGQPEPDAEVWLIDLARHQHAIGVERRGRGLYGYGDCRTSLGVGDRIMLSDAAVARVPARPATLLARRGDRMGRSQLAETDLTDPALDALELWPIEVAEVTVVDRAGRPIEGVAVGMRVYERTQPRPAGVSYTAADGVATLAWLRAESPPDRRDAHLAIPTAEDEFVTLDEATIQGDAATATPAQRVTLTCPEAGRLDVTVRAQGRPVPDGTWVLCGSRPVGTRVTARTVGGKASFWPVGVGARVVAVALLHTGDRRWVFAESEGPKRPGQVITLRLETDRRLVSVAGRAVTDAGVPLAWTRLKVGTESPTDGRITSITTGAEGRFDRVLPLDPEEQRLELVTERQPRRRTWVTLTNTEGADANTQRLGDLVLRLDAAWIKGIVVDAQGCPLRGVAVRVVRPTTANSSGWEIVTGFGQVISDATGTFLIQGEPPPDGCFLHAMATGARRHVPIPIVSGARHARLVMESAGILEARLRVPPGVAAERLELALWAEAKGSPGRYPSGWLLGPVDQEGRVRVEGLEPGTYTASVRLPAGGGEVRRVTGIPVRSRATVVDGRLSPMDLSKALIPVRVDVTDAAGRPLAARLVAYCDHPACDQRGLHPLGASHRPAVLPTAHAPRALVVECDGYFAEVLDDVGPGPHQVKLHRGIPVPVHVAPALSWTEGFSWHVELDNVKPGKPGRPWRRARSFRGRPSRRAPNEMSGIADVRVREPGTYRVRLLLEREIDGHLAVRDLTPSPQPWVRVTDEGAAPISIEVDEQARQQAVREMLAVPR